MPSKVGGNLRLGEPTIQPNDSSNHPIKGSVLFSTKSTEMGRVSDGMANKPRRLLFLCRIGAAPNDLVAR